MRTNTVITQRPFLRATLMTGMVWLALTMMGSIKCLAQERQARPAAPPPGQADTLNPIVDPNEDYRISPGDVIDIQIERAPELSGTYRVGANGTFMMRYLGRITAHLKTTEELATFIADGLRERYLKNPHVSVTVKQINSHAFFIQGAVNHPGVYQMEGRPSLLKLITVAGGLTEKHGPVAFIIREIRQTHQSSPPSNSDESAEPTPAATPASQPSNPEKSDDKYEILRVNINGLFKGDFNQNMYVEPGSIINIPPSDVFFVAGEVNAPGSFQLKEGTTLRQAISMAQGTTFTAAKSRGLIFRENPSTGQRQEIKIDIDAVMSGKKEDVQILANDIIIVPNNRFKSVSSALLSAFGLGIVRSPVRF